MGERGWSLRLEIRATDPKLAAGDVHDHLRTICRQRLRRQDGTDAARRHDRREVHHDCRTIRE
jgi:hypothetical protein